MNIITASIGVSGAGKSHYFSKVHTPSFNELRVCPDNIREVFTGNMSDQTRNKDVFVVVEYLIREAFLDKRAVSYDATNYSVDNRKLLLKLAYEYNAVVHFVYINTPLDVCLESNEKRDRVVPDTVIHRQHNGLVLPNAEELGGVDGYIRTWNRQTKKLSDLVKIE